MKANPQYNEYSSDPKTKGSENPIEQLSRVVTDLAAQVKRFQTPSHSSGIYQKSYQHKSSYREKRDRRDNRHSDKRHHKDSRDHRHKRDHHHRSHNKPYTKEHEVEAQSDCDSECSCKSESESDHSDQDTSTMENPKKLNCPSQSNRTLPECLRGPETIFKRNQAHLYITCPL